MFSDIDSILKIHEESKDNFEIEINREFILEISQRNDFRFFISTFNKKVVGFIGVLFYMNLHRGETGPISVSRNFRNRGVGTKLLSYALKFMKDNGVRRIIAKVKFRNKIALSFFKKRGFVEEGFFRNYTRDNEDVVQLVKFITN